MTNQDAVGAGGYKDQDWWVNRTTAAQNNPINIPEAIITGISEAYKILQAETGVTPNDRALDELREYVSNATYAEALPGPPHYELAPYIKMRDEAGKRFVMSLKEDPVVGSDVDCAGILEKVLVGVNKSVTAAKDANRTLFSHFESKDFTGGIA